MADAPDDLIRQWFEELWNQGREDTIDRLLAPNAIVHGLPSADGKQMVGPAGFKPLYRTFRAAFPDMRITVERTVRQNDLAAAHVSVTGTHRGDTLGSAPTNQPVRFSGMVIVRAANGQLVEGWNQFDFMTMYQQIGMLPQV